MKNRYYGYRNIGFFFIVPALALIIFIYLNPIIRTIWYSLVNWKYLVPYDFNWFKNYIDLLSTRHFFSVLLNNLTIVGIVIPVVTVIALFFAQSIYSKIPGYKFYSFLFFIPVVLPDLVVAETMIALLNKVGPINTMWQNLGLDFLVVDWLGNPRFSLYSIIISLIWKNIGFAMILFLARLTTVEKSIYEAAEIDGATDMQTFRYISFPILKNIIFVYVVLLCYD